MVCPRCGASVNPEQRYCMKCGALNYEHPDNQKMKQYITVRELERANQDYQKTVNTSEQTIEIGGKVYTDAPVTLKKTTYVDTRAMLTLLLIFTICLGAVYYFVFPFSFTMTFSFCLIFFIFAFLLLSSISIYMKGGYSGFTLFIPFYGQYAYFDIAIGNGWWFLLSFVPIVGAIYALYISYKIGKAFGKSGWLTLFFPFIMIPIIAFSDRASYIGPSKKYQLYVEKGKKRNTKLPAFIFLAVLFLVFIGFTQLPIIRSFSNYFTREDVERVVKNVKNDIRDGLYLCNESILTSENGDYYISVDDLSDVQSYPIPVRSSLTGEIISGYFHIQVFDGEPNVSYLFTDGKYVFSNHDITTLKVDDISLPKGVEVCKKVD